VGEISISLYLGRYFLEEKNPAYRLAGKRNPTLTSIKQILTTLLLTLLTTVYDMLC